MRFDFYRKTTGNEISHGLSCASACAARIRTVERTNGAQRCRIILHFELGGAGRADVALPKGRRRGGSCRCGVTAAFGMAYLTETCYSGSMKGRIESPVPAKRRTRLRQAFLVFLTAAYVLVGFGGEITCAEESLGILLASMGVNATARGTDDADS